MAVKTPGSIINDGMMSLVDLHYNERKAALDMELASAKKSVEGRQVLPGVMAQLMELKQKEQQQKEKIAKQGQSQQLTPKAMMPPMTETTGQMGGRSGGAGVGVVAELAGKLISKGGPQPAGQPIQGGVIQGGFGQTAPAGTQPQQVPGSTVPVMAPLSTGQRVGAGLKGVLGIAGKSVGTAFEGFGEAISGEREVGQVQVPTVEQIGAAYGPGLAEIQALAQRANDPAIRAQAQTMLDQKLAEVGAKYGPDAVSRVSDVMTETSLKRIRLEEMKKEAEERAQTNQEELKEYEHGLGVKDIFLRSDLERRNQIAAEQRKAATPEGQASASVANATRKAIDGGWSALNPGEQIAVGGQTAIAEQIKSGKPQITPAQQTVLQRNVEQVRKLQSRAVQLKEKWMPDYFRTGAALDAFTLENRKRAAPWLPGTLALTPDQDKWLADYAMMDQMQSFLSGDRMREEIGSQRTEKEIELMINQMPSPGDSVVRAGEKLDGFIEMIGLDALRSEITMKSGYGTVKEGATAYEFGDVRKMVGTFANATVIDLQNQGMDPIAAKDQVRTMLKDRFGLILDNYTTAQPAE